MLRFQPFKNPVYNFSVLRTPVIVINNNIYLEIIFFF